MKRRILIILALAAALIILPACTIDASASIKSITKPYIAQYECVEARFGDSNLLDQFEYIKVVFVNDKEMEILYKYKDGEQKTERGSYSVDPKTRELTGELGLFGFKFKEKTVIKNGEFVVTKNIGRKELFLKFRNN